ncbi:hypothetical protein ACHAXN_010347 [Cyclotella atomus]
MKTTATIALLSLQTGTHAFLSPPLHRSITSSHPSSNYPPTTTCTNRLTSMHLPSLKELASQNPNPDSLHPTDSAQTTPQLLHALWGLISDATKNMQRGDSFTVLFPAMNQYLTNGEYVSKLMAHLDACKDVCDDFGINTIITPYIDTASKVITGFTVKSFRNPYSTIGGNFNDDPNEMRFAPDPFWDENEVWDFSGLDDDEVLSEEEKRLKSLPEIKDLIPQQDEVIIETSQKWVDRMMADLALCPFTASANKSGIPAGPVRYAVDRVKCMEEAYAAYWQEVCLIEGVGEGDVSTTLHILPEFCMNSVEMFEQWADTLTGTLEALNIEELLQLIFFHPDWTFRDGGDRSGQGLAANYARRSPWPMVNILRTKQVRTAQKGIPTGLVYQQNEKTLNRIGTFNLEKMLRLRDWSEVAGMKVNRKDMEALRVAQDLQVQGAVRDEDTSFMFDSTPAANKVDRSQIDGGNMVNVITQALEIRLGQEDVLNGAQTSAAMMASDFLLEELSKIQEKYPGDAKAKEIPRRGYAAAYGFDMLDDEDEELEDAQMSALWGGGGVPMTKDEDNPRGMDVIKGW